MSPDQIASVRSVVDEIGAHPDFASRFYRRLFEQRPDAELLFADVERQQRALTAELGAMVSLLDDVGHLDERARALGARHRSFGVRAKDYRVAREALVDTLDEVLGDGFGPAEREAWTLASSLITELMQSG
ncbi:MAG: globin domain-containing protein [Acidimicrobiales bacterium]|nr:hypothetical protein [Acidimicrobiales bacterium]